MVRKPERLSPLARSWRVAVIGAGISGLAVAKCLLDEKLVPGKRQNSDLEIDRKMLKISHTCPARRQPQLALAGTQVAPRTVVVVPLMIQIPPEDGGDGSSGVIHQRHGRSELLTRRFQSRASDSSAV